MEVILVCLLLNKQTYSVLTTQVYFNSCDYLYICATCSCLYLSHPQSCQYSLPLYCFCIDVPED